MKVGEHRNTNKLLSKAFNNGLLPVITNPIRITHAIATVIDIIYTNEIIGNRIYSGILQTDISNHLPVFIYCGKECKQAGNESLTFKHRKLDHIAIKKLLEN